MKKLSLIGTLAVSLGLLGCDGGQSSATSEAKKNLTPADAKAFLVKAQDDLMAKQYLSAQSAWIYQTNITEDTAAISAYHGEQWSTLAAKLAKDAAKFDHLELDADTRRQLDLMKKTAVIPAPADPELSSELSKIMTELDGMYGKGKYTKADGSVLSLGDMTHILATSKNERELKEVWEGWREISVPMKELYTRQIELANIGSKELGFKDTSELWRSKYDMPADEFPKELDRLWNQAKPFYDALHCHVRAKLGEQYGTDVVPQDQAIPAHLLGNMWAQTWGNIYDIVKPEGEFEVVDITKALAEKGYDEKQMVVVAEDFFKSVGFEPLPETFWTRSQFLKPRDREVVCHASAWDLDDKDDLRIKMCIQRTGEDFQTIHHELGHNFYQRAYKNQPLVYRNSANDGFHEAVGDTISLSITPKYLKQIGLIDEEPDASNDLGQLMQLALDKIAFLPFGLMIDQWRWKVLSEEVKPEDYNKVWWEMREKYQGVRAPVERRDDHFDPGAKYHIPGNTPYTRYFLAFIQQFQFHKAMCEMAGDTGPIHRCTIYGNKEVGKKLEAMLENGMSVPWQDSMEALTGQRDMDASAILDYFAPLKTWLDEQNKNRSCGW